ncbi:MAG: hypothetical protein Q8N39_10435 [Pelolinea sp.]|nr:hypothetical protein [Pelolinea sp.]
MKKESIINNLSNGNLEGDMSSTSNKNDFEKKQMIYKAIFINQKSAIEAGKFCTCDDYPGCPDE